MREILFRGKRVDNGEWVEGNYGERFDGEGIVSCISKPTKETISGTLCYDVDPSTVGQYTGLKDRNGKKIFELDIISHVEFPDEPALICWHETGFAIKGLWYSTDISSRKADIEVVGNIHDNPDLIGGEKR